MIRGTFANIRLRNALANGAEGGVTRYLPSERNAVDLRCSNEIPRRRHAARGVSGQRYGSGSSRDWAAKGPYLLGIKAVIAESFERIHRSNLIGMGILPLEYLNGADHSTYGLTGEEVFDIAGFADKLEPGMKLAVRASDSETHRSIEFPVRLRIDTPNEAEYYRNGGILQYVLRQLRERSAKVDPSRFVSR